MIQAADEAGYNPVANSFGCCARLRARRGNRDHCGDPRKVRGETRPTQREPDFISSLFGFRDEGCGLREGEFRELPRPFRASAVNSQPRTKPRRERGSPPECRTIVVVESARGHGSREAPAPPVQRPGGSKRVRRAVTTIPEKKSACSNVSGATSGTSTGLPAVSAVHGALGHGRDQVGGEVGHQERGVVGGVGVPGRGQGCGE